MIDRLPCCVPFCRRTCRNDKNYSAYLCPKHWPLVPRHLRRRQTKLERLRRKRFGNNASWTYPAGSPVRLEAVKLDRLCGKAWDACKRQAIERAMGI